jgi:molybdenum cofactor cytidylyltransferase
MAMAADPDGLPVAALLMAAGLSSRMGGPNKLLTPFMGAPLIVHGVRAVSAAGFARRIAVLGRDSATIGELIAGGGFEIAINPRFAEGFGTSLAAGFSEIIATGKPTVAGALVMLADMPFITAGDLDGLIAAFRAHGGKAVVRASCDGRPGNPVIVPLPLFEPMAALAGEKNGRDLIAGAGLPLVLVETGPAALNDLDTPDAFDQARDPVT